MKRLCLVALALSVLLSGCAGHRSHPSASVAAHPPADRLATVSNPPETSHPQAERYRQNQDGESGVSIDVSAIPEPVPQVEPRSRYGNRSPYSVLGRSYTILPSAKGYVERGIASWYGNKFHGYMTSSFEPYDMYQFSAAHKSLPLPSWAIVTNLQNKKSVIVRVNDRGPFHDNRVIDLSYAAAVKIGVWPAGTGLVEVRAIEPGEDRASGTQRATRRPDGQQHRKPAPEQVSAPSVKANAGAGNRVERATAGTGDLAEPTGAAMASSPHLASRDPQIYLQVGSFGEAANAERAAQQISRANLGEVRVIEAEVNGHRVRRVRIGPLKDAETADRLAEQVHRLGLGRAQVAVD